MLRALHSMLRALQSMLRALQSMLRAPLRIRGPYVLRAFRENNPAGRSRRSPFYMGLSGGVRCSSSARISMRRSRVAGRRPRFTRTPSKTVGRPSTGT